MNRRRIGGGDLDPPIAARRPDRGAVPGDRGIADGVPTLILNRHPQPDLTVYLEGVLLVLVVIGATEGAAAIDGGGDVTPPRIGSIRNAPAEAQGIGLTRAEAIRLLGRYVVAGSIRVPPAEAHPEVLGGGAGVLYLDRGRCGLAPMEGA